MSFRSNELVYGDTRNPDGAGRRIIVSQIPKQTKVTDLFNFFKRETVEGISIISKNPHNVFAFVQFKRPTDHTEALLRNEETFMGLKIKIRNFNNSPAPTKGEKRTRSEHRLAIEAKEARAHQHSRRPDIRRRTPSPVRSRARSPAWSRRSSHDQDHNKSRSGNRSQSRNHSRSRERSCSRSPARSLSIASEIYKRAKSSSIDQSKLNKGIPFLIDDTPNRSDELLVRQHLALQRAQPKHEFAMPPAQFQNVPVPTTFNGNTEPQPVTNDNSGRDIPTDVELTLKFILELGTASNLSLYQINNLMQYLEKAKSRIEGPIISQVVLSSEPVGQVQNVTNGESADAEKEELEKARHLAEMIRKFAN